MLMEVYTTYDLDNLDDWIENILIGNKVMEGFHEEIQQIKDKSQEKFCEVEKYYNTVCLEIF